MGLSLEGFGGEFEIGKIAFELEDLKKEERRGFFLQQIWRVSFGRLIYIH